MANKLPVKFYYNTMPGMPQITNQYGETVAVLDCVLVNGTTPIGVTSITFNDGVCTVTTPTAHGFIPGMVIETIGADQPEYTGDFRVVDVSTYTFTFVPPVSPAVNAATGTITVRIPPLGYEIAFTATNKRVYRSKNLLARRPYLRVDNTFSSGWNAAYGIACRVSAAASMTDIDTYSDGRIPYDPANPTRNDVVTGTGTNSVFGWHFWFQSLGNVSSGFTSAPSSSIREWSIVGDDQTFYFVIFPFGTGTSAVNGCPNYAFGNYKSAKASDQYGYMLFTTELSQVASSGLYSGYGNYVCMNNSSVTSGAIIPRTAFGGGDHVNFSTHSLMCRNDSSSQQISNRTSNLPYPNGTDFSIVFNRRYICDTNRGDYRGYIRGQYFLPQVTPYLNRSIVKDVMIEGSNEKRSMLILRGAYDSSPSTTAMAYDITGPWD